MFINQTLQERYSRILEHLAKIDDVISETLGLARDGENRSSVEDSPASPDESVELETAKESDRISSVLTETEGISEAACEMTEGDGEIIEGNSDAMKSNSEIMMDTDSEMCGHDSESRAVSEEDLAYEGPEIVIDAQIETGTEGKNETE
ncbi:hypothetical protein GE061_011572 [Apolygus lucorum]|uniref:Uncharacterized protein n=1 Tax=Apolygus lucorum TaxID=248454 RepID=A0A8S9XZY4_APOLU|nr:hypothetical protein GE061_011572 [Apolygus lucorum]